MSETLIECIDLSVGYEGQAVASNISFTLHEGEYLCVLGENGAGKTTLMKTLLGLVRPISGQMHLDPRLKKEGIGYLPQQPELQKDFPATVMEVVMSGFHPHPWYHLFHTSAQKRLAEENLRKIGAEKLMKSCFSELSGGQKQRVLLARALCSASSVLLVDEPVSGLDPAATEMMYATLRDLHKEGVSVVMITHDVTGALSDATHVLLIDKEPFFGTAKEFSESGLEAASRHFLGGHDHD